MTYHKHSRNTKRRSHERPRDAGYPKRRTEQLSSTEHRYSRYMNDDNVQPRRRRWAAGYIDRPSCPSYTHISTRARSPYLEYSSDTEYITQSRAREDDYIEAGEQRNKDAYRNTSSRYKARTSRQNSPSPERNPQGQRRHVGAREPCYASDIEDLITYQHTYKSTTRSKSYDSDSREGSDIVMVNRRDGGSDIASIHSRLGSHSRSDRLSARSSSMRSDVQERKKRNVDSDSDDEGGYISLDDYIDGRSDCMSNRSLSEGGREGSDAVGSDVGGESDVGEQSDTGHGSDVASLSEDEGIDDEEDCIDGGNDCHTRRRRCQ